MCIRDRDEVLELRYQGSKLEPGTELQKTAVIDLILGDGSGSLNRIEDEEVGAELDGIEGESGENDNN